MKNLRIGVVGVGHIGSNHARLYAETPSAEFTAVYDLDPITNRTIATKFGATAARSLDEFIGMVDAASVATPTNTHYTIARALLAKDKHVLVEKPITDNTAHATELAELICEIVGFDGQLAWDTTKPDGTPRKLLDVSKIRTLGWTPAITLRDGITGTYEWFRANRAKR